MKSKDRIQHLLKNNVNTFCENATTFDKKKSNIYLYRGLNSAVRACVRACVRAYACERVCVFACARAKTFARVKYKHDNKAI
jgi:hypothetical protein